MEFRAWSPAPLEGSEQRPAPEEWMVTFDRSREARVLVLPALFDEANKLRRSTLTVMRALDETGIDSALPDLPGCHESRAPMDTQTLARWRSCAAQVAHEFGATHALTIRGGALTVPSALPGWRYAPLSGAKLLANALRAQVLAEREAGRTETRESLMEQGRKDGLVLGGWPVGSELLQELEAASEEPAPSLTAITQEQLGGGSLWLRAEPGEDSAQSEALARIVAEAIQAAEEAGE